MERTVTSRTDLIQTLLNRSKGKDYLEIGCAADDNFKFIEADTKVGVDPIRGGTHRMGSDQFFAENSDTFDVVFVDGLHSVDQATRDVDNSLARLNKGGVVVIHDCLPPTFKSTDPQILADAMANGAPMDSMGFWCGEVWRVVVKLIARKDIDLVLWPEDLGCAVVVKRPSEPVKFAAKDYADYMKRYPKYLTLVDEKELTAWLAT